MASDDPEVQAFYARHFECLERVHRANSPLPSVEALHYSLRFRITPPRWVLAAAADRIAISLRGEPSRKAGRASSGLPRDRMHRKRFVQADGVDELIEEKRRWRKELEELNKLPRSQRVQAHIDRLEFQIREFARTLESIFQTVHKDLIGTPFAASAESIKSNYYRVKRDMKDPAKAALYYFYEPSTLRAVGLEP